NNVHCPCRACQMFFPPSLAVVAKQGKEGIPTTLAPYAKVGRDRAGPETSLLNRSASLGDFRLPEVLETLPGLNVSCREYSRGARMQPAWPAHEIVRWKTRSR